MKVEALYIDFLPVFEILNEAVAIVDNEKFIWVNDAYVKLRGARKAYPRDRTSAHVSGNR